MQSQGQELESPRQESNRPDTKTKWHDAAAHLFASQGYIGASLRKLVAEGDADQGSVHYHFCGKHGLFQAVLESRFGALCVSRHAALDAALAHESHTLTDLLSAQPMSDHRLYYGPAGRAHERSTARTRCPRAGALPPDQRMGLCAECEQASHGGLFESSV